MIFTLTLWDLGLWLGLSSILVLITSEIASWRYGRLNIFIEFHRMRKVTIVLGAAFLVVTLLNMVSMV